MCVICVYVRHKSTFLQCVLPVPRNEPVFQTRLKKGSSSQRPKTSLRQSVGGGISSATRVRHVSTNCKEVYI